MRLAAPVPLTGRYTMQGRQMAAGLKLWAYHSGAELSIDDDQSDPQRAVHIFQDLSRSPSPLAGEGRDGGFAIVLGPYGSDSVRAVATALPDKLIWNHGAAADDVQRLPNVISLTSPSSCYLVALTRAVARLRPGASVAVVTAAGRFADSAWTGLQAEANAIEVTINGRFTFNAPPSLAGDYPSPPAGEGRRRGLECILTIGPLEKEIELLRQLHKSDPSLLLGGVSPGLLSFPEALGADPEGILAPVQWHPALGDSPRLGPSSQQVLEDARSRGLGALDYVAAQAYAAALIAAECLQRSSHDPAGVARKLRSSTFFGDFELDSKTGEQRGHQMGVVQWLSGRQELVRSS
jgi:ABC-type branched-subunit amino acid transport system substrate-binding protein